MYAKPNEHELHIADYRLRNRYLLVRHGHSQANACHRIVSDPANGLTTAGLSPLGITQLDELIEGWHWPLPLRIVHSDFLRTTQTAQILAHHFALPTRTDPRLRERHFGELEGEPDHHYESVWAYDRHTPSHCEFGVESLEHVASRMMAVIEALEIEHHGEVLMLVSHGDPLHILLTHMERRPLTEHRQRPALEPSSITLLTGDSESVDS